MTSACLHSIERPGLTPVFGTTVPTSGVSGAMREMAFRFSESDLRHWLLLLLPIASMSWKALQLK
jgi:hypothetical protein